MTDLMIAGVLVFIVSAAMTMVGKGGGNFFVLILAVANIPMHEAAATAQFILFSASVAAISVFRKHDSVSWTLALLIGSFTALSALGGGYFSHLFSGFLLKMIFALMLLIAGLVMLIPVSQNKAVAKERHFGVIRIRSGNATYAVNLWIVLPITIVTGFGSGMVGVSGGSFLVPLMVLACSVPMHTAVGTASILIAATAFMGFTGHALQGDFNPSWAVLLAFVAIMGAIVGGKFALKTKPKHLKQLFAYTNWLAALFMVMHALHAKGVV